MLKEVVRIKKDLSLLSIDASEEIKRFSIKKNTNLENAINLSKLIKNDFMGNLNYQIIFSNAYFATYLKKVPPLLKGSPKQHHNEIAEQLSSPLDLNDKELNKLADFCTNLSDYFALYQEEINNLKGPCF